MSIEKFPLIHYQNERKTRKQNYFRREKKNQTFVLDSPDHAHKLNGSIVIKTFSWNEAIQKVEFIPLITVCVECEVCFYRSACQEIKVFNVNTLAVGNKRVRTKNRGKAHTNTQSIEKETNTWKSVSDITQNLKFTRSSATNTDYRVELK